MTITSIGFIEFLQVKLPAYTLSGMAVSKTRERSLEKALKSGKRDLLICVDLLISKRRAVSLVNKIVNACARLNLCVGSVDQLGDTYTFEGKKYKNFTRNKAILHFRPRRTPPHPPGGWAFTKVEHET